MSVEKTSYKGTISMDLRNKETLKNAIIFGIIIFPSIILTLAVIVAILQEESLVLPIDLVFWIFIYGGILPYIGILIITVLYETRYVRNFSYKISENNIVINHGVFTKTRATVPFSRIQNINIVNGVFDRMFKTFTVKIETAGSSGAAQAAQGGHFRPEGYIPGLKDPYQIEKTIKKMLTKYSQVPSGLEDKIFKPEEVAFDNFISYILSKMREGEKLKTSIKELMEKANITEVKLAEQADVPIQTINYLIEGRYNPSLALAYRIAEVLKCKIEDLFKLA